MYSMMYDANFTYDSSMPIYENKPPSFPYTLDYKVPTILYNRGQKYCSRNVKSLFVYNLKGFFPSDFPRLHDPALPHQVLSWHLGAASCHVE